MYMSKRNFVGEYTGKRLIGIYKVCTSEGNWDKAEVFLDSQEEVDGLIKVCNNYSNTMELVDIVEFDTHKSIFE